MKSKKDSSITTVVLVINALFSTFLINSFVVRQPVGLLGLQIKIMSISSFILSINSSSKLKSLDSFSF